MSADDVPESAEEGDMRQEAGGKRHCTFGHGRRLLGGSLLLLSPSGGQLRVGSIAESEHTKAAMPRGLVLDRGGFWAVIRVLARSVGFRVRIGGQWTTVGILGRGATLETMGRGLGTQEQTLGLRLRLE